MNSGGQKGRNGGHGVMLMPRAPTVTDRPPQLAGALLLPMEACASRNFFPSPRPDAMYLFARICQPLAIDTIFRTTNHIAAKKSAKVRKFVIV